MKIKKIIFISTLTIALIAGIVALGINKQENKIATNPPRELNSSKPHTYSSPWNTPTDDERIKMLSEQKEKVSDTNELKTKIKEKIKVPRKTLDKKLLGAFIDKETNGVGKQVDLYYEQGLYIEITPIDIPIDYEKIVLQDQKANNDNSRRADSDLNLIEVRGLKGISSEPGFNVWDKVKEPRPGVVAWYENGAEYKIYGFNTPTVKLLEVAESMEEL